MDSGRNTGLFCYEPQKGQLHNYTLNEFSANVQSVAFDNSGTIWVGFMAMACSIPRIIKNASSLSFPEG